MKAVILLNGEFSGNKSDYAHLFDNAMVFCADGGANMALYLEVIPEKIIGDMDSISTDAYDYFSQAGVVFDKYDEDKDFSDFELILDQIHSRFESIYVLGGLGGRTDHSLFNLYLLERFPKVHFFSDKEEVFVIESSVSLKDKVGASVSIIPLSDALIGVSLEGFKYPLLNDDVWRGTTRTLSNIIVSNNASINIRNGKAFVVINKENKYEIM